MKILIYGANDIGSYVATTLFEDHDITIIDEDEEKINDFSKLDIDFVVGNPTNIEVLEQAGIKDTDVFISCTYSDEANMVSALMVKKLKEIETMCFVSKQNYFEALNFSKTNKKYISNLDIDYIIWPEELLMQEILRIITVPEAIDVENFAGGKIRLLEYRIKEDSFFRDKKIKDCTFPDDVLIVGVTRDEKLFIPNGDTILSLGDKVIFMGTSFALDILAGKFFTSKSKIKNICIIGGGSVGLMLAYALEKVGIKTKIIEKSVQRCEFLSETLQNTLIINGNGTDLEILETENIGDMDAVVSVTNNDEKNLLCCLLAKQLGTKKVITRVTKSTNAVLFEKVGIDVAISAKDVAMKEIRNYLIVPEVDILATVEQGQGDILEIFVPDSFPDTMVMDIKFPSKAIIAIIQRNNKIIIPKGQTQIMGKDCLIIFTTKDNTSNIQDFFKKV